MLHVYLPLIMVLIVIFILFNESKNKRKRYWVYKNIKRNEVFMMLELLKTHLNKSVIIETISSKYYGKLIEINDEYLLLNSGTNETDIIKIEFIVAISILKEKEKRKKKKD